MDLLLINLPCKKVYQEEVGSRYMPPLGLMSIASYAAMHGYSTHIKDYNYEEMNYSRLRNFVVENTPKMIGITVYTENCNLVCRISQFLKEVSPSSYIMVGGPHASLKPDYFLPYSSIDFVEIGEGESSTLELLEYISHPNNIDIDGVPNVRVNKKGFKGKSLKRIGDLDLLPMADRSYTDLSKISHQVTMYSSKGCPANCIYCAATALSGASFRVRSAENLLLEIVTLREILNLPNIYVVFADDTFTAIKSRVKRFYELVNENHVRFTWACESRVDVVDEALVDFLYNSGCIAVQFGIESGSQEVLDKLRKKINLDHAKNVISYAYKYNMEIHLSFMLGHYCDTPETMQTTVDFMHEIHGLNENVLFAVSYNTPLPGTWQHTHAAELGLKFLTRDLSKYDLITPVAVTDNFSQEQLDYYFNMASTFLIHCEKSHKARINRMLQEQNSKTGVN